ncbi:MAG TPA: UDP-N-acetylmuramate--L-alanine ligase [Solirubrobacteraceae bacterium]|jgi:UDP-N-acetylmuramate--alanine ligase|nr:UDP-N-acetylmuramate--L-alanine ligase [Solirubrobacteraceae bacterium]
MTLLPWQGRRIHVIGIGGAGMSAYAAAAAALGASVSGSDLADSPFAESLRGLRGVDVRIGHDVGNIPDGAGVEVFWSSAIKPDNIELVAALERGLVVRPRADLLGELTRMRRTIGVAGAHGKTTTASMIVAGLRAGGLDPGYVIGGTLRETGRNGEWGSGEWLVVEADESDRSMLALDVEIAVLTSVELDHHAEFGSRLELERAYRAFVAGARVAVIRDRPELIGLRAGAVVGYDAPEPVLLVGGRSEFEFRGRSVRLGVPGAHNAENAAAALEVCVAAGADIDRAIAGLEAFKGAARRFELLGSTQTGAAVYDDYAHHPTEIAATLAAARTIGQAGRGHRDRSGRVVAVFQPHLYSRTAELAREFGAALAGADVVVVVDVYPARERAVDFPGVSGRLIAAAAVDASDGRPVYWLPGIDDAERVLRGLLRDGDLCLVIGAGDIDRLGRRLVA